MAVLKSPDLQLPDAVAMLLGIYSEPTEAAFPSVLWSLPVRPRMTRANVRLPAGVRLLDNRETGAYMWNRVDGRDEVIAGNRVPGWRMTISRPGELKPRGRAPDDVGGLPRLEAGTSYVQVAQVLCPFAGPDLSIPSVKVWVVEAPVPVYVTVCWAPESIFPRYESLFEKMLSDQRIYVRAAEPTVNE